MIVSLLHVNFPLLTNKHFLWRYFVWLFFTMDFIHLLIELPIHGSLSFNELQVVTVIIILMPKVSQARSVRGSEPVGPACRCVVAPQPFQHLLTATPGSAPASACSPHPQCPGETPPQPPSWKVSPHISCHITSISSLTPIVNLAYGLVLLLMCSS